MALIPQNHLSYLPSHTVKGHCDMWIFVASKYSAVLPALSVETPPGKYCGLGYIAATLMRKRQLSMSGHHANLACMAWGWCCHLLCSCRESDCSLAFFLAITMSNRVILAHLRICLRHLTVLLAYIVLTVCRKSPNKLHAILDSPAGPTTTGEYQYWVDTLGS